VAIDYFTKWVDATCYANVMRKVVAKFIRKELICRYGLPSRIIIDNDTNLNNKMMSKLCGEFKIQHHNSSTYHPKMNGAVEATNKNIKKINQKMVVTYKDWHEMLPFAYMDITLQFGHQLGQHHFFGLWDGSGAPFWSWNPFSESVDGNSTWRSEMDTSTKRST